MTAPAAAAPPAVVDYRLPQHRRAVFLDFYDFHLTYRAHPGGVYYLIPWLAEHYGWTEEQTLWFAFLNGNTQNPVTSLMLFEQAPTPTQGADLLAWWRANYDHLAFDTDRRYHKKHLDKAWYGLMGVSGGDPTAYWRRAARGGWAAVWAAATAIPTFGRLSAFSFTEYLRIAGLDFDCEDLMVGDIPGSRSHRNGLCIVDGLDQFDWHASNPAFDGRYPPDLIAHLTRLGADLLAEARRRRPGDRDVSYFTLESTLCTYKGWHRPRRRYPNVYNDMLYDRIKAAEKAWPRRDHSMWWQARADTLPAYLRLEDSPHDPGCVEMKQNHYLRTGEPIMMHRHNPAYRNSLNDRIDNKQIGPFR